MELSLNSKLNSAYCLLRINNWLISLSTLEWTVQYCPPEWKLALIPLKCSHYNSTPEIMGSKNISS